MKTILLILFAAALSACSTPNYQGETGSKAFARGLVRAAYEKDYYDPYRGYARDDRMEQAIFGNSTPIEATGPHTFQ